MHVPPQAVIHFQYWTVYIECVFNRTDKNKSLFMVSKRLLARLTPKQFSLRQFYVDHHKPGRSVWKGKLLIIYQKKRFSFFIFFESMNDSEYSQKSKNRNMKYLRSYSTSIPPRDRTLETRESGTRNASQKLLTLQPWKFLIDLPQILGGFLL